MLIEFKVVFHKLVLWIFFLLCFHVTLLGQNLFSIKIIFPKQWESKIITLAYENGKGEKNIQNIKSILIDNQLVIKDSFYSKYAAITVYYSIADTVFPFHKSFFIGNTPAIIHFYANDSLINPLENCDVINAYEFSKIGENKLRSMDSVEANQFENFLANNRFTFGSNDSLVKLTKQLLINLCNKKLEFIKENGDLYYSFWVFRKEVVPQLLNFVNPVDLLQIFDTTFPDTLKNSLEGVELSKIIIGKINSKLGKSALDFISTDINGQIVTLKKFRGKYILLNFWATYCGPCIEELPSLKEIRKRYSEDKLVIISISYDKKKAPILKFIKKYGINWVNIFNDEELIKLYGNPVMPSLFLIDETGKIIYGRDARDNLNLDVLKGLLIKKLS